MSHGGDDPKRRLLSEDEWAALAAERYEREGSPVDEVANARVWERLEPQVRPRSKPSRRQTSAILLAAGVVAAVGAVRLLRQEPAAGGRDKGDPAVLTATLGAFVLDASGDSTPVTVRPPEDGETVVFRVRAPRGGRYALVVQEGAEPPRVVVPDAALGVEDALVQRDGGAYGYRVGGAKTARFCALAAESAEALAARVRARGHAGEDRPARGDAARLARSRS